jgi:hypothetical protein
LFCNALFFYIRFIIFSDFFKEKKAMNETSKNKEILLQELLEQIKKQNNRISKLEKRLGENSTNKKVALKDSVYDSSEITLKNDTIKLEKHTYKTIEDKPIDWQWIELMVGNYGLQLIGVIVFLLGMGFLLKYSIDKGWLTPAFRVFTGLMSATGLMVSAEVWRQKCKGWANPLMAGGVVLYYFSFYAAHNFYQLISPSAAFIAFFGVTVLAGIVSLGRNSLLMAMFSLFGGYLTPLFLSHQAVPNAQFLAVYSTILSLGFFIIAYAKKWLVLPAISFLFIINYYKRSLSDYLTFNQSLLFLMAIGTVYSLMPYLYTLIFKPKKRFFESIVLFFSGISLFLALYEKLSGIEQITASQHPPFPLIKWIFGNAAYHEVFKYLMLFFGTLYLIKYVILYVKHKANDYLLITLSALFFICYAGVILFHFNNYSGIIALHLLGLLLLVVGFWLPAFYFRLYAYLTWVYTILDLIDHRADLVNGDLVFNLINARIVLYVCSFMFAACIAHRFKKRFIEEEESVPELFASAALLTIFYWFHTNSWVAPYHVFGIVCYAFILFVVGIFRPLLRSFAYLFWTVGLGYFYFSFLANNLLHPENALLLNLLYALLISTVVAAYYLAELFEKNFEKDEKKQLLNRVSGLISLLLLSWGRSNIILLASEWDIHNYTATYTRALNVALTIFYGIYALIVITIGLFKQKYFLRYLGLFLIALALGKLCFIIMAMNDTLYRIVSFIIIGVLMLVISLAYQQLSKRMRT